MPQYYCDMCQKLLGESELRYIRETQTTQGPIVFSTSGHTTVGLPLSTTVENIVVKCCRCGLTARAFCPTVEEIKRQKYQERENVFLIIVMPIILLLFLLLYYIFGKIFENYYNH